MKIFADLTRYGCLPHLDLSDDVVKRMEASVDLLQSYLSKGCCVYGKKSLQYLIL
jgi:hypothetical protein